MNRTFALNAAGFVFLWAVVSGVASGQGQNPPAQVQTQAQSPRPVPAFRSRVTLVPLDVRVIDRDGKPVTDLTKSDFTIFEGSEPQTIAHFDAHGLVAEAPPPKTRPALRQAPGAELAPARGRTFLIVLGRGRIQQPFDGVGALTQFVHERLLPQDHVAVMAYNRATDFTTDHQGVIAVLERFGERHERIEALLQQYDTGPTPLFKKCKACLPEFILPRINEIFLWPGAIVSREMPEALGEGEDIFGGRDRRFYDTLIEAELTIGREPNPLADEAAARRAELVGGGLSASDYAAGRSVATQDSDKLLNGITLMRYLDGEKNLVFLADKGLSLTSADEDEIILRAAADARIVLHTIVTGGIPGPAIVGKVSNPALRLPGQTEMPGPGGAVDLFPGMSMKNLAAGTGGLASITRYPREALARIDEITRFEYLLGYYPANSASDGNYRKVEVKVNRPGVTVLVRSGYYANDVIIPRDRAEFMTYQRIAGVGSSRDSVRDLALTLKASQAKGADKNTQGDVIVNLGIDPSRIGFERVEGRYVATLEVRVYCSDPKEKIVGQVANTVSLNLTEDSYRRYRRAGIPYTARIAVKAAPRWVKAVIYDAASDLAGSTVTRLK
jgi:VWFA-related protein